MRFGFIGEWHKYKLPEVAVFLPGLTYSPSNIRKDGKIVLRSSNIQNGLLDLNDIVCVDTSIVKENLSVKPFDTLMCIRNGSKKLVGKTALIKEENPQLTWGAFMAIVRPTNVPKSSFVFHFLNSRSFFKQIFPDTNTATVNQITAGIYKGCYISIPSIYEQLKISEFLDLIDRRIAVQNKIIEECENLKEETLRRLFSDKGLCKNGTEKRLAEFLIPGSKQSIDPRQYRRITVHLNYDGLSYSDVERELKDKRPFYVRRAGELIIGKQNYFNGSICIVGQEFDLTVCSNAIMSFKIANIDPVFFLHAVSNKQFLEARKQFANGTGQKELSEKDFLSFKIVVPAAAEQQRIAKTIGSIDRSIALEKRALTQYLRMKSYLLTNMFI